MYIYNKGKIHRHEMSDSRKDYQVVTMQLMVNRKGLYSKKLSYISSFGFLSLTCQNQDFHRYVNSTAQTPANNQTNSASVQQLASPCTSARNTRQNV